MALVIEDGTLVANANSFLTRDEIIAYALERGVVIPDEDATDVHAIRAMDFLWALPCLRGELVDAEQSTPYPRKGLVAGDTAEDWVYTIPKNLKRAFAQLALDSYNGIDLSPSGPASAILKRSKVGPIEREFFEQSADAALPQLTMAMSWLNAFICASGIGLISVRR